MVKFITPIYHPNVNDTGEFCVDILMMPPFGTWTPMMMLVDVLVSIQQSMSYPCLKDPLSPDIVCRILLFSIFDIIFLSCVL